MPGSNGAGELLDLWCILIKRSGQHGMTIQKRGTVFDRISEPFQLIFGTLKSGDPFNGTTDGSTCEVGPICWADLRAICFGSIGTSCGPRYYLCVFRLKQMEGFQGDSRVIYWAYNTDPKMGCIWFPFLRMCRFVEGVCGCVIFSGTLLAGFKRKQ